MFACNMHHTTAARGQTEYHSATDTVCPTCHEDAVHATDQGHWCVICATRVQPVELIETSIESGLEPGGRDR